MKNIQTIIAGMLILFSFSSCKVGKEYVRPDLHLPDSLVSGQDASSLADLSWWEVYTDSTLQNLIKDALAYNRDLLAASARVKEMAARKRISTAALLPQIDGKVRANNERSNDGGKEYQDISNKFEGKFLLAWEIDLWGRLRWGRAASIAEYLQSVEARRALQMTIIAEVAQAYYELIAFDTELDIVKKTLESRKEGVRLARIRFEGGLTSETAYRQSQVELARTASLVPDLEREIALKEHDIAFLAGRYPGKIQRSLLLTKFNSPKALPTGLPSALLENRPDIRGAEQKLIAANAAVGSSFTAMFPKLSLTGEFGLESKELTSFLKSPYSLIEGALLTPILGWGKHRSEWKTQKAAYERELYNYEKTVLAAFKDTHNAIVNFNKLKEVYEMRLRLEQSYESYLDLAQLQYINGVINYLDVLDAQRGYFDAQIGLSKAIRDEMLAIVQIYKALGGGWEK